MDRISRLPDDLLVKILLLVPTKLAVSTSVLSKRWEFLWMWLPKLKFCHSSDSSSSECHLLQCFLNENLPLHRAPVIESFSLDWNCSHYSQDDDIKFWVVIAIYHCVRELEISYCYNWIPGRRAILPSNLYTSESLVILKLKDKIILDVPRMVSLPSLKTLKLEDVRYSDDDSLHWLLSNCPILEDLSVNLRKEDITGNLSIAVPSLQRLSIFIPNHNNDIEGNDIEGVKVATPSLKYLKLLYHNTSDHYFLIEDMPNLIEACVDVDAHDIESIIGSITSVKRLAICLKQIYDGDFDFKELEHLEVCTCKKHMLDQLVNLLDGSPNLQVLNISSMDDHECNNAVCWNEPSTVPKCVLSRLHTLNWSSYTGEAGDKELAVYILQNAIHLKTARVIVNTGGASKFEVIKELALFSRASTTCQVIIDCSAILLCDYRQLEKLVSENKLWSLRWGTETPMNKLCLWC